MISFFFGSNVPPPIFGSYEFQDLNKMFLRTYGALYEQNAGVFQNLFKDLKAFFHGRNVDLGVVLNHFFEELLKKMFQLINAQYQVIHEDCKQRCGVR